MTAIEKINWDTVDYHKTLGDFITLPDGRQHYIEMTMTHWYWLEFMQTNGQTIADVVADIEAVMQEEPCIGMTPEEIAEEWDELFRIGLLAYGKTWVQTTETLAAGGM